MAASILNQKDPVSSTTLQSGDLAMFQRLGIAPELLVRARVERVTDREARDVYGIVGTGDMSGIVFPYFDPWDGHRVTARIRRDNPEIEAGKSKRKYIAPFGNRRHLYFPPTAKELLSDLSIPIVLVEAEKSSLALTAFSGRQGRELLAVAMGGCWGWRGRIGRAGNSSGQRVDELGALPELGICCNGRKVYVLLDCNVASNTRVEQARRALVDHLINQGADVSVADLPAVEGVNGPDDYISIAGDEGMHRVLELARPAQEVAIAEVKAAIAEILAAKPNVAADQMRRALDAVADVSDALQRTMLENQIAAAVRGVISKQVVVNEVSARRLQYEAERESANARDREIELRSMPVNGVELINQLEAFFAERAHLPGGAALLLAYFTLNTWTFQVFDTVPYLLLESAVPGCGKSTVIRLLATLSCRSRKASSLSEAVMFRLIDAEAPSLFVDEAEVIEGRSERAEALRAVAHEGYKRGGQVPRCTGDSHEVQWFDVYCPKVFAAIGGLTGALLDRCLVLHMEKAPKDRIRKSTRFRALIRDSQHLSRQLESYAIQAKDALLRLYEAEPDCGYWPSITDREAELWGPLLIHARLAGSTTEADLLEVVKRFSEVKAEIKSAELKIALTIELLNAISAHPGDTFAPGDLLIPLCQMEEWGRLLAQAKGRDEHAHRVAQASKIGYFLRAFRLLRNKGSSGNMEYERQAAISCLSAHVPSNPPNPPELPSPQSAMVGDASKNPPEDSEPTEALTIRSAETTKARAETSGVGIVGAGMSINEPLRHASGERLEGEL